jgi:putative heme iron utilization protein
MDPEDRHKLAALLRAGRWAALATARDNEPLASWVAVVAEPGSGAFLLHLSRLAPHTRYLETNPRAALAFSEPDAALGADPQTLARVSLQGTMRALDPDGPDYRAARACYLARLPHAEVQFGLGDFRLWRFVPSGGRYVPGFGRVHRLDPGLLARL